MTQDEPGFFKKNLATLILTFVIIVISAVGGFLYHKSNNIAAIDSGKYQAVFFTNGQVYFGKLSNLNRGHMELTDVYYLQSGTTAENESENPQTSSDDEQNSMQLVKLGSEIHGPEDKMIISKSQVLFFENLKSDGKVSETIEKYQQGQ